MKIESIETLLLGEIAAVRVRTDDGVEGIGQTAPYGAGITAKVLHELVAPFFLDRDPWDIEVLVARTLRAQYKFPGTFVHRALCGVDTAIWDLLGKVTGQPVHKLIGGAFRTSVPMYASSMRRDISPEDEGERLQRLAADHGFRAAKIRVAAPVGQDADAAPGRTERIIPYIRSVMGDGFDLSADANGGFTAARAIRIGRMLEDHGYFHFEEPCPYDDLPRTAEVAATLDIPVAGGEQDNSLKQFHRIIDERVVDIVQPDIGYLGGLNRARQVAILADIAGVPCTPHCANNSMLRVFTLHLAAAMPACHQPQEWGIEDRGWERIPVYEPMLEVVGGQVAVPTAPGWGVELVPSFIRDAERVVSRA
ncbi:MAG TPA: mandelate racemase/muconate lactonizing enzyme family protein [Spirillospora sp.]|nr:mandelate racemase/muconate lactonizing enzyme family protein [Spirillospora sp.]